MKKTKGRKSPFIRISSPNVPERESRKQTKKIRKQALLEVAPTTVVVPQAIPVVTAVTPYVLRITVLNLIRARRGHHMIIAIRAMHAVPDPHVTAAIHGLRVIRTHPEILAIRARRGHHMIIAIRAMHVVPDPHVTAAIHGLPAMITRPEIPARRELPAKDRAAQIRARGTAKITRVRPMVRGFPVTAAAHPK